MPTRVFIVHKWDGTPDAVWYPWLKNELEARGAQVIVPPLPDTAHPHINAWVPALADAVGTADEHTYFVGHSMGCQTIARYLASLPNGTRVGGAVFVAGFFTRLTGFENEGEGVKMIVNEWLGTPLDLSLVHDHLAKSVAIFSDNDPYVPLDNQNAFRDTLDARIIIEHAQGHMNDHERPAARDALLSMIA